MRAISNYAITATPEPIAPKSITTTPEPIAPEPISTTPEPMAIATEPVTTMEPTMAMTA